MDLTGQAFSLLFFFFLFSALGGLADIFFIFLSAFVRSISSLVKTTFSLKHKNTTHQCMQEYRENEILKSPGSVIEVDSLTIIFFWAYF